MKIYFSGGGWDNVLLSEGVKSVLMSYAEVKDRAEVSRLKAGFTDIMLDSGAYSVATGKAYINIHTYTLWLELYLSSYPQIKHYVVLDDINSSNITNRNQEYMEAHGLSPLPVFHYKEPVELLDRICSTHEYIGLGGIATNKLNTEELKNWWELIYNRYSDNKFHLFAVGNMSALINCQPYSVDTTTWLSARFGSLLCLKKSIPSSVEVPQIGQNENGDRCYLKWEEIHANNIRALLDWAKMDWTKKAAIQLNKQFKMW